MRLLGDPPSVGFQALRALQQGCGAAVRQALQKSQAKMSCDELVFRNRMEQSFGAKKAPMDGKLRYERSQS